MMDNISRKIFVFALFGLALGSCKSQLAPKTDTKGLFSEGKGYLWDSREINVCWEEFGDKFVKERELVSTTVTAEYAHAGFTFKGWKDCRPGEKGIWIKQMDREEFDSSGVDGIVDTFGKLLDGRPGGVRIFFDYTIVDKIPENLSPALTKGYISNPSYISLIALHEIGHALGLRHEADRADASCFRELVAGMSEEPGGAIAVGAYDKDSIMNYCTLRVKNREDAPPKLSAGDIATLKLVYDHKTVFPREKSCEDDGNSWTSQDSQSCCEKSASGKYPAVQSRIYRFCEELQPFGGDPIIIDKKLTVQLGPLPFAKPGIGHMSCDELDIDANYIPSQETPQPGASHVVDMTLMHPTRNKLGSYNCRSLTIYDKRSILGSSKAIRYTFSPPATFPIDRKPASLDLSRTPYQTLNVKDGLIEGEGAPQAFKEPSFKLRPQEGTLVFSLPVANRETLVREGTLDCGVHSLKVLGQYMNPGDESHILELMVHLNKDVLGSDSSMVCKGLDLTLYIAGKPAIESSAKFTFSQALTFQLDGRSYKASLPSKTCFTSLL